MQTLILALVVFLAPTAALSEYVASSSSCRTLEIEFDMALRTSINIPSALAMSQDGKHCSACYHNNNGKFLFADCLQRQKRGASTISEAALAACEDMAKQHSDSNAKCKIVRLTGKAPKKSTEATTTTLAASSKNQAQEKSHEVTAKSLGVLTNEEKAIQAKCEGRGQLAFWDCGCVIERFRSARATDPKKNAVLLAQNIYKDSCFDESKIRDIYFAKCQQDNQFAAISKKPTADCDCIGKKMAKHVVKEKPLLIRKLARYATKLRGQCR